MVTSTRAVLLGVLIASSPLLAGETIERGTVRFRLPDGCRHKPQQGIDSAVGLIVCRDGLVTVHYDIGRMAGDYCDDKAAQGADYASLDLQLRRTGPAVRLCSRRVGAKAEPFLVLVAPASRANFYMGEFQPVDVVTLLALAESLEPRLK